jgi:sulfur-oxidizing protein SoxX
MRKLVILLAAAGLAAATAALAQTKPSVDPAKADVAMKAAFPKAPADWLPRLVGDQTMRECSEHRNAPPAALASAIQVREKATIQYPVDGKLLGDWKKGNALAQSGYGLRFTDYPPKNVNGGNCFACHQLTKQEISFGTVGPSLLAYGKIRKFSEADIKAAYEKIYNGHAALPCSLMPRFGTNNVLTIDQIKDLTALLMSPDSPVNN